MPKNVRLGIFGFGCVGQGLYQVLSKTHGIKADIKKICIKDPTKPRILEDRYFTTEASEILDDPEIDVVVELIDDPEAALKIAATAMKNGKAVVSANKKMIADNLPYLHQLQTKFGVPFLYEASVCASIPIIRNLEEYYDNDLVQGVEGIFNGSTNYILTSLFRNGNDFQSALQKAQELGFAETDPTLDIEGFDPKYKLCIILLHAFGIFADPEEIVNIGISHISKTEIDYAREKGLKIKLIASCFRNGSNINAFCIPRFVNGNSQLSNIEDEYNAVDVETVFSETQLFVGKGAGDEPTGSAVLSDISALTYGYKYEYKKLNQSDSFQLSNQVDLRVYVRFSDDIDRSVFSSIEEEYNSQTTRYLIGNVSLEKLKNSSLINDPNVCVIQA